MKMTTSTSEGTFNRTFSVKKIVSSIIIIVNLVAITVLVAFFAVPREIDQYLIFRIIGGSLLVFAVVLLVFFLVNKAMKARATNAKKEKEALVTRMHNMLEKDRILVSVSQNSKNSKKNKEVAKSEVTKSENYIDFGW
ncbi:MAG: hypothetical protein FWG63_08320 [Defluviitaleaceae bacterium]|nr:hypothetical protein [Defluviitaleaceae bacterium]